MSLVAPFTPLGNSVLLVANSTAPTGIQAPTSTGLGASQYHVVNTGSQIVFLSYANTASTAQTNAVIPTGTGVNATTVIPILAGSAAIYSLPSGYYFSGITGSVGANNVYITPGEGN